MIILILIVVGLCLGSFVGATVWRIHEQSMLKKATKRAQKGAGASREAKKPYTAAQLSITRGHSLCPHCGHQLTPSDLVPLLSWVLQRGKCRYCKKPIGKLEPAVELATAALFVLSYIFWPDPWTTGAYVNFILWLLALTAFIALFIYDIKWMLLPNRIVYPLTVLGAIVVAVNLTFFHGGLHLLWFAAISVAIAGGLFYLLFFVSNGKWIGGGDVKIGFAIGLFLMNPYSAFLMLFTAAVLGTAVSLPGMVTKKLNATSKIPFGPFLIVATIIVRLFGASFIAWYKRKFLTL